MRGKHGEQMKIRKCKDSTKTQDMGIRASLWNSAFVLSQGLEQPVLGKAI